MIQNINSTKLLCEPKAGVFKGFLAVIHSDHILGVESSSQNNLMGQLDTAGTPAGVRKLWGCLLYYEELHLLCVIFQWEVFRGVPGTIVRKKRGVFCVNIKHFHVLCQNMSKIDL